MKHGLFKITVFYLLITLVDYLPIKAQENINQLVITEVKLDLKNKEIWIEVYNPGKTALTINSLRISGIRTPNILPAEFKEQKSAELQPGERIIISSDKNSLQKKYGKEIRVAELKPLENLLNGGFAAINHMTGIENSKNIIRLGDASKSLIVEKIVDENNVLSIANDNTSYSREISNTGEPGKWYKTIPTPGK